MTNPYEQFFQQQQTQQPQYQQAAPVQQLQPVPQPQYQPAPVPQYAPPAPPVQPAAVPAGLDDFYAQPSSGGGASLKFTDKPIGHEVTLMVTKTITKSDIRQQTDPQTRAPKFRSDGSPMWVMVIPGLTSVGEEVSWWCRGQGKDALQAALLESGTGHAVPVKGSVLKITKIKEKRTSFGNNQSILAVEYHAPQEAPTAPAPAAPAPAAPAPAAPPVPAATEAAPDPAPAPQASTPGVPADMQATFQQLLGQRQ